jgi:hypothetical protein
MIKQSPFLRMCVSFVRPSLPSCCLHPSPLQAGTYQTVTYAPQRLDYASCLCAAPLRVTVPLTDGGSQQQQGRVGSRLGAGGCEQVAFENLVWVDIALGVCSSAKGSSESDKSDTWWLTPPSLAMACSSSPAPLHRLDEELAGLLWQESSLCHLQLLDTRRAEWDNGESETACLKDVMWSAGRSAEPAPGAKAR